MERFNFDITPQELKILKKIKERKDKDEKSWLFQLCEDLKLKENSVYNNLKRLSEKRFIEFEKESEGKKRKFWFLTERGNYWVERLFIIDKKVKMKVSVDKEIKEIKIIGTDKEINIKVPKYAENFVLSNMIRNQNSEIVWTRDNTKTAIFPHSGSTANIFDIKDDEMYLETAPQNKKSILAITEDDPYIKFWGIENL